MALLKIFLIAMIVFISPQANAGFYVPVSGISGSAGHFISRDSTSLHQSGPKYKKKKVTIRRANFYAVLGFFPLTFLLVPSPMRRYLGYRQVYVGYFLLLFFLLGGMALLLFTPWLTAALIALGFYVFFNLALAYADLKQLLARKVRPVNGRYFTEPHQRAPSHF